MCFKFESANVAQREVTNVDAKITNMETKLQEFMEEINDLEIRLEEVVQESGIIAIEMIQ